MDEHVYRKGALDPTKLMYSLFIMSRAFEESEVKSKHLTDVWEAKRSLATDKPMGCIIPALTSQINKQPERLKLHQYLKRQLDSIILHKNRATIDIILKNGGDIHLNYDKDKDVWVDNNGVDFRVTTDTRWN